jgi:hypothetical protein
MRSRWIVGVLGVWLVGGAVAATEQPSPSAPVADEAAIRSVIATYARAVDAADPNLASTIWADAPEVSFINLGSRPGRGNTIADLAPRDHSAPCR